MLKKMAAMSAAVLLVMSLSACSGGAGSSQEQIWYSTKNSTEEVHVAFGDGVVDAAEAAGYSGEVTVAESDAAKQNEQLNNLVQNIRPKAIIVNPYDSDSVSDVLARANDAEIPVAVVDNKANNADVDVSVLFDSVSAGEAAGEKAVELLTKRYGEPKGVVVNLYGEVISQVFKERAEGFEKVLKEYPKIEVISALGAPESDVATSALSNILADAESSGKKIDLVNTPADTATLGAAEALKTHNLWHKKDDPNHVFVISVEGQSAILDLVREGYVDAEVVLDAYGVGGIAVEVLNEYTMQGQEGPTSGTFEPKGDFLNKEVTFEEGDTGPTIMLDSLVVDEANVDDERIWGNANN